MIVLCSKAFQSTVRQFYERCLSDTEIIRITIVELIKMFRRPAFDEGRKVESSRLKIWRLITEDTSANTFLSSKAHDEVHFIWRDLKDY